MISYRIFHLHYPLIPFFFYVMLSQSFSRIQNPETLRILMWVFYPILNLVCGIISTIISKHHFEIEYPADWQQYHGRYILYRICLSLITFVSISTSYGGLMSQIYQYDQDAASLAAYATFGINHRNEDEAGEKGGGGLFDGSKASN